MCNVIEGCGFATIHHSIIAKFIIAKFIIANLGATHWMTKQTEQNLSIYLCKSYVNITFDEQDQCKIL